MDFVHRCHFCGWQREARSPTVLPPRCGRCGGTLTSIRREEDAAELDLLERISLVRFAATLGVAARLLAAATTFALCTRLGYVHGGASLAVAAFGLAGLATVPLLVPR
jgi:hypothetical protein